MGKLWEHQGKSGKTVGKIWKNVGNMWKNVENCGKNLGNIWENCGKNLEKCGKYVENCRKNVWKNLLTNMEKWISLKIYKKPWILIISAQFFVESCRFSLEPPGTSKGGRIHEYLLEYTVGVIFGAMST